MKSNQNFARKSMIRVLWLFSMLLVVGCQTTGNPAQGGLFGWDEEKAKERSRVLEISANKKKAEVEQAKQTNNKIREKNQELVNTISSHRVVLNQLLDEREALKTQLEQLKNDNQITGAELVRLQQENPWLNKTREEVVSEFRSLQQDFILEQRINEFEAGNKALTSEVILLIGR